MARPGGAMTKKRRRGAGEGTISQVKGRSGLWKGTVSLGFGEDGKRRRKAVYGKSRAEVQERVRNLLGQAQCGIVGNSGRVTLGQWPDAWLDNYGKISLRPTTFSSYETQIRVHIKPVIGGLKLGQLRASNLQALYTSKLSPTGRADKDGRVSARGVRYLHQILHVALHQAVREGLLAVNPADGTRLPKMVKPEIKVLDRREVAVFLKAARECDDFPAHVLTLSVGLRRGELLGLGWHDVDCSFAHCSNAYCHIGLDVALCRGRSQEYEILQAGSTVM